MKIYPNLEAAMVRAGINRTQMAGVMGVNVDYISRLFQGKRKLTVRRAMEIRDLFFPGMSIDFLFEEKA